jgi:hypothetical protein
MKIAAALLHVTETRYDELVRKFGGTGVILASASDSWFRQKIAELGELLKRLPDSRQRAFRDALDAPVGPLSSKPDPTRADASAGDDRPSEAEQQARDDSRSDRR